MTKVPAFPDEKTREWVRRLDAHRGTLAQEIEDDVAPARAMTVEQRGRVLESVCRDAWAILQSRPDFDRAVAWREPRSGESMATWLELVRTHRAARGQG